MRLNTTSVFSSMLAASIALAAPTAPAQSCSASSPAYTVALLELYTSEGCDSCPPADKFVGKIRRNGELSPAKVIPLALHVDYWDYLGWKDRFANPAFGVRQRELTELSGSRTVYTPQIFVSGKEERNWRSGIADTVQQVNAKTAQANIKLTLLTADSRTLKIDIDARSQQAATLFYALTENNLSSQVNAGENRGITLQHDAVVRSWGESIALPAGKDGHFRPSLPVPEQAKANQLAVVAFIQAKTGAILQALSLPLCPQSIQTAAK